jgi:hypothetical protein
VTVTEEMTSVPTSVCSVKASVVVALSPGARVMDGVDEPVVMVVVLPGVIGEERGAIPIE